MESLSFLADKYFNQNLVTFIVSVAGVIFAKEHEIECLMLICFVLSFFALFSLVITLFFYAVGYGSKKYYKAKCYRLRYKYVEKLVIENKLEESKDKPAGHRIILW